MHTMPSRRGFLAAASTLAASAALPALAQDKYPRGPIRLIVGLPPGGSADVCARAVAGGMEGLLKQPILVDNRPGGQFKISMQALLNAPADGQTLLYIYNSYAAVQVTEKLFNIERETVPIMKVGTTPAVLMVRADSPFKSLQDFVAHARAHPGKLSYSTFGPAGIEHIKMAEIAKLAGIQCLPVPYRGGPDAITALLGGEIDICLNASIFAKNFASSGKLRTLAVLGKERWSYLPEVPTIRETGLQVEPFEYWGGIVARTGTPASIIERLHHDMRTALQQPSVIERFESTGNTTTPDSSPLAFGQLLRSDVQWITTAAREFVTRG